LIAPPTSEEERKNKRLKKSVNNSRNNHKGTSGKVPNHEYCDYCKEGGDLLCCDQCPAAFHLGCKYVI